MCCKFKGKCNELDKLLGDLFCYLIDAWLFLLDLLLAVCKFSLEHVYVWLWGGQIITAKILKFWNYLRRLQYFPNSVFI